MDNPNNQKRKKWWGKNWHVVLALLVFLVSLAAAWGLFGLPDIWKNVFVVIVSVAATYVIVALVGRRQTEDAEEKERSIQMYQSKLDTFSTFTNELWTEAGKADYIDYKKIRAMLFSKTVFYLTKEDVEAMANLFNDKQKNAIDVYSKLTALIKSSLENDNRNLNDKNLSEEQIKGLWNSISSLLPIPVEEDIIYSIDNPESNTLAEPIQQNAQMKFGQAWHFAMWDETQLKHLGEGKINELSLTEWNGESWRTNLIKQVGENDVVFLFRRGGYGYIGAFKPLGWRVFDGKEKKETEHYFGKAEEIIPINDERLNKYDIYGGIKDGADLASNLIVEPIKYVPKGVGNPGGVYRRTISRYDSNYAAKLLERFNKA